MKNIVFTFLFINMTNFHAVNDTSIQDVSSESISPSSSHSLPQTNECRVINEYVPKTEKNYKEFQFQLELIKEENEILKKKNEELCSNLSNANRETKQAIQDKLIIEKVLCNALIKEEIMQLRSKEDNERSNIYESFIKESKSRCNELSDNNDLSNQFIKLLIDECSDLNIELIETRDKLDTAISKQEQTQKSIDDYKGKLYTAISKQEKIQKYIDDYKGKLKKEASDLYSFIMKFKCIVEHYNSNRPKPFQKKEDLYAFHGFPFGNDWNTLINQDDCYELYIKIQDTKKNIQEWKTHNISLYSIYYMSKNEQSTLTESSFRLFFIKTCKYSNQFMKLDENDQFDEIIKIASSYAP